MIDDLAPILAVYAAAALVTLVWSFDWKFFYAELERLEREEQ